VPAYSEGYRRSAVIFFTIIILVLSFLILRPFFVAIMSAAALAYIFYPLYLLLLKRISDGAAGKFMAAFFTCAVILLVVLIPMLFMASVLAAEIKSGYQFLKGFNPPTEWSQINLPPVLNQWSSYLPQFKEIAGELTAYFFSLAQGLVKGVPNVILNIFITIFSVYYFLKHGKDLYNFFSEVIPLPDGRYKQILSRFDELSRGMLMGQIVVGSIQGVLAWLGFWLLGVPNPVIWGFMTAIISMIPLLGAAMVWVPIAVYLLVLALSSGEYWRAIVLFIYGTSVISFIDNLLKPKIVGDHAKIHPLIVLFGILGGIQLFGLPGILIGPLILTIFDVVIEIYKEIL